MSDIPKSAVHCINPDCQRPYPQSWGNKFCNSCGTVLQLLDRYVPIQPLGSGGFAQIYTVWDEKTQSEKVLKVLVEDSPKAIELFTQEATVLISLRHPGVPRVEADGNFQVKLSNPKPRQLACLVMEKINGQTLEEILENYPKGCPEDLVLNWFTQAVKILQELHKRQIIHRDIKPSNLMLRTSSPTTPLVSGEIGVELVLIDFGGVKQFNAGMLHRGSSSSTRLFSSGYSPPEQVTGGNVSPGADFYALGRTMIELLTGKYPPRLEDPVTGKLRWRTNANVKQQFADLLDEMVQEDVRSRPANAAIILKRLAKMSQSSQQGLVSQLQDNFRQISTQVANKFTQLNQAAEQALGNLGQGTRKTLILIVKAIFQVLKACVATIWAILLTSLGACIGTIAGFILAYRTTLGDRLLEFASGQLAQLIPNSGLVFRPDILVFFAAGLGTTWGLTTSGCFGQRRRFLVASLMGIISYGFGWLFLQLIIPADSIEGLLGVISTTVFLLSLSFGFPSHHIVYAVVGSFGTTLMFAVLLRLGFPANVLHFSNQPLWSELSMPIVFFGLLGIFMSFWLSMTYYLIVPGLRLLGWR